MRNWAGLHVGRKLKVDWQKHPTVARGDEWAKPGRSQAELSQAGPSQAKQEAVRILFPPAVCLSLRCFLAAQLPTLETKTAFLTTIIIQTANFASFLRGVYQKINSGA